MRLAARRPLASLPFAFITLSVIAALGLPGPAAAQDVTGTLQGTVVSPEGAPEPDVRVSLSGPHLQGTRETVTSRDGFYQFLALPPGTYTIRVGRIGLRPVEVRGIIVELGRTTGIPSLTLSPEAIGMEPVEVVASATSLDPVHTTMGGVLNAQDYAFLPVDRDYKSIISILPLANESYRGDPVNVAGSTGLENQYYIDGINVTDTRFGSRATSLPYNFVRSVSVRSGGYEARYGRAMGAVVDAITYSGTNTYDANLFALTLPSALTMDPKTTPVIRERRGVYYDFGGRVGGPIMQDRLWYSAALNPRVEKMDKEISGQGFYRDKTTTTRFATKLTWRAGSATNFELSVFGDPTTKDQVDPPSAGVTMIATPDPVLERVTSGGTVAALRVTATPARALLLEGSIGKQWDRYRTEGTTSTGRSEPLYIDYVQGSQEGGVGFLRRDDRTRTSLAARGTLTLPRHTIVAGTDYEDLGTTSQFSANLIYRLDTASWWKAYETYSGAFHNRSPAAYVQDTWRLTEALAVNVGLRWSAQHLIGASGRTAERITDEWQPRAGFSWQLGPAGRQRVFGSYGRFYQTVPTNIAVYNFVDYIAIYSDYSTDPRQPGSVPDNVLDATTYEVDYAKQIPHLEAENYDEFTVGYERIIGASHSVTIRGIRRHLRSSFQWGVDLDRNPIFVIGTPGQGDFDFLPAAKREYTALEISADGRWRSFGYRASYVLSRNWGNYPGLYNSDFELTMPGQITTFFMPYQAENSTGLLPNDQPHVIKLASDYRTPFGLRIGSLLSVASGSPVNDFGAGPDWAWVPVIVRPRGTAGRTPTVWNLDVRLGYDLPSTWGARTRVQLDVLHVGNPRGTTRVDEWHYNGVDANGNPTSPSPTYKQPIAYQPPMALRLGMEVSF